MGEVYRARDGRLKRIVALKILPTVISGDPSRVARFLREAELLASLNHPNIAAIYDVVDDAGSSYLIRDGTLGREYDVAPDGRFLMLKYSRGTEQGHFVLVQGWTTELARLVP